jgi:hypothetical protein
MKFYNNSVRVAESRETFTSQETWTIWIASKSCIAPLGAERFSLVSDAIYLGIDVDLER